ncbi:hypothetical protein [Pedobacter nutrimenti]|jgi:hypothetical protein|uniref:Uncharacterized protein n=1 Tax=Pedobacter nutrimenti TaxID=1241337 RepID=A0A318U758_9SPHI|nr:hypothetical protein [Pedobacter nutrimenti]PYF69482.1 hypothetical protein B0O44_110122 [Pedobacter nutrimenti]
MKYRILSLLFFGGICLFANLSYARPKGQQHLPGPADPDELPAALKKYIPKGYQVLNVTKGNLNQDQFRDLILVLNKINEEKTSQVVAHPEKRPLLIFTGTADKKYHLAARNDNAVYCYDCGGMMGDPFMGIVIKKGYFSIEHYGGSNLRWTRTITFKYTPAEKDWLLYKDGGDRFQASAPDVKPQTKVYTIKDFGHIAFKDFDVYKEKPVKK